MCPLNHSEREYTLMRIIAGPVQQMSKSHLEPTQCGAALELDELVVTAMCEDYLFTHDTYALRVLKDSWCARALCMKDRVVARMTAPPCILYQRLQVRFDGHFCAVRAVAEVLGSVCLT